MATEQQVTTRKKSRASKHLSELVNQSYLVMHDEAKKGAFVIWAAICVPTELFKGFDNVTVAIPENHGAMSAAKNAGVPLAEQAEALGYSMDICSYARIDLGVELTSARASPAGGLPKPDLLVSDTNNCSLLVKWFDVYHRLWGVPHFIIDVPYCYEPQQEKDTAFIVDQFKDLILLVESMTDQKFNVEKVKQVLCRTNDALHAWKEVMALAARRPSPVTAFDTFAHMAPYVTMRGDPEVTRHCKLLLKEAKNRVDSGDYPVPDENYRLLWDGIAPWHQLRSMKERLAKSGANIVHATYTACIGTIEGGFEYPYETGSDPLQYLARIQNFSVCPYGVKLRFRAMSEIIDNIGIDGVIFASNRSCKVYSIMQMDLQRMITETHDIPAILVDVDHADVRKYNEENVFLRIEALLELIDQRRKLDN
ncbi:MAG TPA: 2-hydroxyacyl-CoA dehydratase family protein [Candidatus Lokiarchaeia archaeon]|nr:2-hydroxyacyl-CoA dehydratase family protein [Candidatus Lokiarchaeia archaeon]